MFVCRRHLGESLLIDGDLLVTLSRISDHFVELTVQNREAKSHVTLRMSRRAEIGRQVAATALRIDINSARLGFELPVGMTIQLVAASVEAD